jgi:predicted DNA-binding protein
MPTNKKRIQIPVSDKVHRELEKLAKRRGVSLSFLSHELLEQSLELQEDVYFSRTVDEVLKSSNKKKFLSHDDAWS